MACPDVVSRMIPETLTPVVLAKKVGNSIAFKVRQRDIRVTREEKQKRDSKPHLTLFSRRRDHV